MADTVVQGFWATLGLRTDMGSFYLGKQAIDGFVSTIKWLKKNMDDAVEAESDLFYNSQYLQIDPTTLRTWQMLGGYTGDMNAFAGALRKVKDNWASLLLGENGDEQFLDDLAKLASFTNTQIPNIKDFATQDVGTQMQFVLEMLLKLYRSGLDGAEGDFARFTAVTNDMFGEGFTSSVQKLFNQIPKNQSFADFLSSNYNITVKDDGVAEMSAELQQLKRDWDAVTSQFKDATFASLATSFTPLFEQLTAWAGHYDNIYQRFKHLTNGIRDYNEKLSASSLGGDIFSSVQMFKKERTDTLLPVRQGKPAEKVSYHALPAPTQTALNAFLAYATANPSNETLQVVSELSSILDFSTIPSFSAEEPSLHDVALGVQQMNAQQGRRTTDVGDIYGKAKGSLLRKGRMKPWNSMTDGERQTAMALYFLTQEERQGTYGGTMGDLLSTIGGEMDLVELGKHAGEYTSLMVNPEQSLYDSLGIVKKENAESGFGSLTKTLNGIVSIVPNQIPTQTTNNQTMNFTINVQGGGDLLGTQNAVQQGVRDALDGGVQMQRMGGYPTLQ